MKHVNHNMSPAVLKGIADGEQAVGEPDGDKEYAWQLQVAEDMTQALTPAGDRPMVVGAFLKAKVLARAQGFIAAYRSAEL